MKELQELGVSASAGWPQEMEKYEFLQLLTRRKGSLAPLYFAIADVGEQPATGSCRR